ncbi:MAG: sodium/solute symporter [Bacteroidetes bacterium]|nr:sodium/solute symporter [Bacteroidota bacterium]
MSSGFLPIDYIVFVVYGLLIVSVGVWISRTKKGQQKTAQDYFLASRSLTWWAIGASLIAANISAEHFIAMSGSGFRIGLGIAAYEWMAAISLIIVAKYFLPNFLENKIYTMPQFLQQRYNTGVSTAFAVFWLLVYVFVNLTTVAWLGAQAMYMIMGIPVVYGLIILAVTAGIYSIYGGLKAVAWTDVIQVIFLVGGGMITAYLALDAVSGGHGAFQGLRVIYDKAPQLFNMIIEEGTLASDGSGGTKDAFMDLPGLAVIFGAMWLANFGYWGFNQYIIQKGLAAKSLKEAKRGLIFAGYLKILIPLIVIIPGITAYVLHSHPEMLQGMAIEGSIEKADHAYPWLLHNFVPSGIKGLAFAALVAAIVSSLASMINSTATIFTFDIYKQHIKPDATDRQLVKTGRWVSFIALLVAMLAAKPLLGGLDQAFQYIQEYTGYIYPGVVVVFGMGLFWRQASSKSALWTAIVTIPAGIVFKMIFPEMPFILRMGNVFILLCFIAVTITFLDKSHRVDNSTAKKLKMIQRASVILISAGIVSLIIGAFTVQAYAFLGIESIFMFGTLLLLLGLILHWNTKLSFKNSKALHINMELYKTGTIFNIGAIGIMIIIITLYALFW